MSAPHISASWHEANYRYLHAELERLRLVLKRHARWLRQEWDADPIADYHAAAVSDAQADRLLAPEDRAREQRFWREDQEAARITQAIAAAERELDRQRRELAQAGVVLPIEELAAIFGLNTFERDVVLLCLAPELDPAFERLFGYLQDDLTRKYVTRHLALSVCCAGDLSELERRDSFLPDAPLHRFNLLALEAAAQRVPVSSARPLVLDERVASYLLGVNRLDGRLAPHARRAPEMPIAASQEAVVERLQTAIETAPWPVVNLLGAAHSGKLAAARKLAAGLGLDLHIVSASLPEGLDAREMARLLERDALLLRSAVFLEMQAAEQDALAVAVIDQCRNVLVIASSAHRVRTDRPVLAAAVPKAGAAEQSALWRKALESARVSANGHVESLVQQFDFGPEEIARAATAAAEQARLGDPAGLWTVCREQSAWTLDELAQSIVPSYTWEDIVLPADAYRLLQEIAAQVEHRSRVYEEWGFGEKLSRGRGISALFSGPSGTGKTMAAEVLARHLDLELYRIDLSGVVSKYIGETEKNLKRVFDAAEQCGAVLFFDEADALFGKRVEVREGHDRYANIEVNYLLQRMEDYRGLAILATNRKSDLDEAFLRRIRFLVDFPFPDRAHRRRIWEKSFPRRAATEAIDFAMLARLEIAGGNIRNIAVNAAFLAAAESRPIGMEHILHACRREYAKIDKLVAEAEFGPYYRMVQ